MSQKFLYCLVIALACLVASACIPSITSGIVLTKKTTPGHSVSRSLRIDDRVQTEHDYEETKWFITLAAPGGERVLEVDEETYKSYKVGDHYPRVQVE